VKSRWIVKRLSITHLYLLTKRNTKENINIKKYGESNIMGRQNNKLIQNIRKLNEKKKIEQQESQILGQKPGNWTSNQGKKVNEGR